MPLSDDRLFSFFTFPVRSEGVNFIASHSVRFSFFFYDDGFGIQKGQSNTYTSHMDVAHPLKLVQ